MLEKILTGLGLNIAEIKTYSLLLENGPLNAGQLARTSGVVRVTQYLVLKRLIEKGFVVQSIKGGVKLFIAKDPEKIVPIFEEKIKRTQQDFLEYQKLLPELKAKQPQKLLLPKFEIFEGAEGLKNVLKDMLLYKNIETQAYWPIKKMVDVLSGEFFRYHNKERIRNNVYTRAIWPENEVVALKKHPYLGSGKLFKREVRVAPAEIQFSMGYWIYGNKVAFLSSRKESFGYIIESAELAEMMLSQFEVIWRLAQPLPTKEEEVRDFLKEIKY